MCNRTRSGRSAGAGVRDAAIAGGRGGTLRSCRARPLPPPRSPHPPRRTATRCRNRRGRRGKNWAAPAAARAADDAQVRVPGASEYPGLQGLGARRCGCRRLGCAKNAIVHRWVRARCGCRGLRCAKSAIVHGFAWAHRQRAAENPCTIGNLAPAEALHPYLTGPHLCTIGDLAHAGAFHPHLRGAPAASGRVGAAGDAVCHTRERFTRT